MNYRACIILIAGLFIAYENFAQTNEDVLLTVNNNPVTVGEFKYIYEKNNGKEANYSEKSLREYLELYSRFKLKVARAKESKLDTIQSLNEELNGYKRQLANSYLTDKEIMDHLLEELKERQKQDIRFKHILISAGERVSDSLKQVAFNKIKSVKSEIEKGTTFEKAALEFSDDKGTGINGGDLGFFSAMLPEGFYELENALYTLPIGKISEPIKTRLGYHLIKVEEKRPAYGTINVAHILIKGEDAKAEKAKVRIDEAYAKLKSGQDFAQVCSEYSQDNQTAKSGGFLPPFGINTYEKSFEEAAFGLKNDGDYSMPVLTKSGWHIIKRVKKANFAEDASSFKKINEAKIKKDERFNIARKALVEDIKKSSGYTENKDVFNKYIASLGEEFLTFKWAPEPSAAGMKEPLITFGGDSKYSIGEFATFAKKNTKTRLKYEKGPNAIKDVANNLLKEFSEEKAIDFEQKLLEIKYPDFKALMREYEEGILLFEATKRAVWDKANQDSVGLAQFYVKNKNNYLTEEKGNLLTYTIKSTDIKKIEKIVKMAKKKTPEDVLKKHNKNGQQIVTYTEETLEKNNPKFQGMAWTINETTAPKKDETDAAAYTFSKITKIFPVRPKTLKEARGYVVADYQDQLDKEWIADLTKAYPVVIRENVLKKLIKN